MRLEDILKERSMKKSKIIADVLTYILLSAIAVVILFPVIYSFAASFKPMSELFSKADKILPEHPTFDNYIAIFTSRIIRLGRMLWNSTYYTILCVVITVLTSTANAYVFERGNFPFKRTIFLMFSSLMFISMGSITVYPLFEILNVIHLNKSLLGLVVIKALGIPVVNIYLIKSYIHTLPKELDEAAKMDGCSFFAIFIRIILPLLKPILVTIMVLSFNASWNEYLMPAIFTVSDRTQQTLMVGIASLKGSGEAAANWTVMLAAANISMIPTLILYAFGSKHFVSGLSAGAVKG